MTPMRMEEQRDSSARFPSSSADRVTRALCGLSLLYLDNVSFMSILQIVHASKTRCVKEAPQAFEMRHRRSIYACAFVVAMLLCCSFCHLALL